MERLAFSILAFLLLVAWYIDYRNFRNERESARRNRKLLRSQYWWNERENGPEGDH